MGALILPKLASTDIFSTALKITRKGIGGKCLERERGQAITGGGLVGLEKWEGNYRGRAFIALGVSC